jgi:hypothetical protein
MISNMFRASAGEDVSKNIAQPSEANNIVAVRFIMHPGLTWYSSTTLWRWTKPDLILQGFGMD